MKVRTYSRRWPVVIAVGLAFAGVALRGTALTAGEGNSKEKDGSKEYDESRDDQFWSDECRDRDSIDLTFTSVGDSRQEPAASNKEPTVLPLSGQDAIWLQNSKAWTRIMRSVQKQRAKLLVFNGDMIMGYGNMVVPSDSTKFDSVDEVVGSDLVAGYRQYGFWRGMVSTLLETGTYVVPVPGNHETQWKAGGKKSQVANENAWRANMGDLILDTNRFQSLFNETPANANVGDNSALDSLPSNQSQLSYSFDFHGSHFTVVNTDPVGNDAHAPVKWLDKDLADAKARGLTHFFVFGHKPAFTYYFGTAAKLPASASGLDNDVAARDAFWAVVEKYGATYFCGHEHIYNLSQPTSAAGGQAWQVLVGSGGSPFDAAPTDATVSATDRYYAWAKVDVFRSGKVRITGYGFDDQFGPTKKLQTITLAH